jgi:hypothetical protein
VLRYNLSLNSDYIYQEVFQWELVIFVFIEKY